MTTKLEQKAQEFASEAHKGQYRKDGITPYIEHPKGVVRLLKENGVYDENILCAAWLHDTMEDCDVTKECLEQEFNPEIARMVSALTRDVKREEYIERIRNADYSVQIVKLGDVIYNSGDLFKGIAQKTADRMVNDSKILYLGLAQKIAPKFYNRLRENLRPWAELE
jgi:guanosine-3',5'-bis(diphosphate) 3'-pyrophosphohydrolase